MSNTQTILPKIILTTSLDLANLFSKSKSYSDYIQRVEEVLAKSPTKDAFNVFLTSDSSNITNFEYTYFGTGAQQSGLRINIEFFDPDETFEKKVIGRTMQDRFFAYTYYIAFGASPDLSNWTNFLVADLVTSEISQDYNKPRTIKLNLASTVGLYELNSKVFKNHSREVKELSDKLNLYLKEPVQAEYTVKEDKSGQVKPINEEHELLKIFKGYNYLDAAFKKLINNFLKAIFNEQQNILFLSEDIDSILDKRVSDLKVSETESLIGYRNYISSYNEAIKAFFTQELGVIPVLFKNFLTKQFNEICPSIIVSVTQDEVESGFIAGVKRIFSSAYERAEERKDRITFSIKIEPRKEKETDDQFSEKVLDVLEDVQSIFDYAEGSDAESGVLIRETDTRIISLFLQYLRSEGREDLINEFNLTDKKPLILFGQQSVIAALLYGREYKSKKITSVNSFTAKYMTDTLETKLATVNYGLYGSKNNLLSPLQQIANITGNQLTKEFIDNQKETVKNILVFRHNVEDPNIIEISVNDYKAYHSFLGVPRIPIEPEALPDEITVTQKYVKESLPNLYKKEVIDEILAQSNTPRQQGQLPIEQTAKPEDYGLTVAPTIDNSSGSSRVSMQLTYPSRKVEKFIEYIFKDRTFRNTVAKSFGKTILDGINNNTLATEKTKKIQEDFDKLLTNLHRAYLKGLDASVAVRLAVGSIPKITREDYFNILLRDLSSALYRVTIKTLPFFFVTGPTFLQEPCLLLSRRVSLMGAKSSALDSLISGAYIIIGITHKINQDSAESEFILQKMVNPL